MMTPTDNKMMDFNEFVIESEPIALSTKKQHPKRDDIQGLRAFAIVSVFAYHLKAQWLPYGYLGVDIFFVISGYLMALILSGKGMITFQVAVDFYYRRLRRIMPTYLLVTSLTLLLATFYVHPMDREDLVDEARGALRLYSNIQPLLTKLSYFQLLNNHRFFAHTWSLCVELQFYLVVPLLFSVLFLVGKNVGCRFCAIIGIITFVGQLIAPPLYVHGFTPLRLWQFMLGILGFYWSDRSGVKINPVEKQRSISISSLTSIVMSNENEERRQDFTNVYLCLIGTTLIMLLKEEWLFVGLARAICTVLSALMIKSGSKFQSKLLTNKLCMWIGDHSYTIYLIHWPLIVYWRYLFGQRLDLYDVLAIVILTLVFTFIIDVLVDNVMANLNNKTSSLVFILILYLACEPLLGYLSSTTKSKNEITISDELEVRQILNKYYNNVPLNLTNEEALNVNGLLYSYAKEFKGCRNRIGLNASNINTTHREIFVCRETGSGQKNALIIGNSLARHAFVGIAHHFRSQYKHLQLHAIENCSPFYLQGDESDCQKYAESLELAFKEFQPDIIFIIYRLIRFPEDDIPFTGSSDEILLGMQWLYSLANSWAREFVFIPTVEVRFRIFQPMDAILNVLRTGDRLTKLRMSRLVYYYNRNRPFHWMRVRHASCAKCILVDWSLATSWRDMCFSVDLKEKLTFFIDRLHVSDIGSYQYGKLLRTLYDKTPCRNGPCLFNTNQYRLLL